MADVPVFTLLSFIISASAVVVLGVLAPPLGLVDHPDDDLKDHGRTVPIVGGVAILGALHTVMAGARVFDPAFFWAVLGLLLVGLWDDLRGLSPVVRLLASSAAGAALAVMGGFDSNIVVAVVLVVLAVVGVNAVNLLDGADGVAGSAALISALGIAVISANRGVDPLPALILAGSIGGFLMFNWPPARTFLGDGGAYAIGLSLAYFMVLASPTSQVAYSVWVPRLMVAAGVFGVFVIDLVVTMLRRAYSKVPLFGGDRSHVYDQLSARGWSPGSVAGVVAAAQIVIVGAIVLAEWNLGSWIAASLTAALLIAVVVILGLAGFVTGRHRGHPVGRGSEVSPAS